MRVVLTLIALLLFQKAVGRVGWKIADLFDFVAVDPDQLFAALSMHHLVLLVLTMIVIVILSKLLHENFGFQTGDQKMGLRILLIFSAVIIVVAFLYHGLLAQLGQPIPYDFELNKMNVFGTLGFQLLLSGPSEEILYRALPMTLLAFVSGKNRSPRKDVFPEVICSAVLFTLAHLQWSLIPFSIGEINPFSLAYAFGMGLLNGIGFQKTRSILYPILMHSISNVVMVGTGYVFSILI